MIAPEGFLPIGIVLAGAAAVTLLGSFWAVPLWVVLVALLIVFREATRRVPAAPLAIVSPVDGTVTDIRKVHDEKVKRQALAITIRIPVPGIGALRSPTEGKVMDLWTRRGPCDEPDASSATPGNRACYSVWIRTDEGDDVVCALSTRRFFSRFKSRVAPGERIGQGQRSGFVYLATRIEVLLPPSSHGQVSVGDALLAGSDIIATLVRP